MLNIHFVHSLFHNLLFLNVLDIIVVVAVLKVFNKPKSEISLNKNKNAEVNLW